MTEIETLKPVRLENVLRDILIDGAGRIEVLSRAVVRSLNRAATTARKNKQVAVVDARAKLEAMEQELSKLREYLKEYE